LNLDASAGTSLALGTHRTIDWSDAMTPTRDRVANLLMEIQGDFLDNPSLSLTPSMAQSRFAIDEATCAGLFGALVDACVLAVDHGEYHRHVPRPNERHAA
jgi:hypothetical protein